MCAASVESTAAHMPIHAALQMQPCAQHQVGGQATKKEYTGPTLENLQVQAVVCAAVALDLNHGSESHVTRSNYLTCRKRPCRWMNLTVPDLPLTRPAAMSTMSPTPICFRVASCTAAQALLESAPPALPNVLHCSALPALHVRVDQDWQDMATSQQRFLASANEWCPSRT